MLERHDRDTDTSDSMAIQQLTDAEVEESEEDDEEGGTRRWSRENDRICRPVAGTAGQPLMYMCAVFVLIVNKLIVSLRVYQVTNQITNSM